MSQTRQILIAEDSRTQAARLQQLLQTRGYEAVIATDGIEALAAARRSAPALVMADIEMPQMDGYAMCRAFKSDETLRRIPIILLTSLSDAADVLRGLEAGAEYYLTKPYQSEYLLSRVAEILAAPLPEFPLPPEPAIEILIGGSIHPVTANRRQILSLLLSTYSDAVQRNQELIRSEQELNRRNQLLDQAMRSERQAHEELKKAQSHLIQSEKMASLGQLVAGIAHEINNPLSFVINNAAVLQRDIGLARESLPADLVESLLEMLESSREGLKRIQQIVADLRDFVRLDQNNRIEISLNPGIESTANILRHKARDAKVTLELQLQPIPPVLCYPAKINQAVLNLIANALDATPPGGKVTLRTAADGDGVLLEVIDTGAGIAAEIRDKIFDPFFTTKPPGKGTGLGLSITFGIIRDHGGKIEVESEPGKGTRFRIRLPLRGADVLPPTP